MTLDSELQQQLLTVFKSELKEHVSVMTSGLLVLEKTGVTEENQQQVDEIFRAAHSLKGAARSVGMDRIVDVAHSLESILSRLNKGKMQISSDLVSKILKALDCIQALMENKNTNAYFELLTELENFLENNSQTVVNSPETPSKEVTRKKAGQVSQSKRSHTQPTVDHYIVSPKQVNQLTVLSEDILATKLEFIQYTQDVLQLYQQLDQLSSELGEQLKHLYPVNCGNEIKESLLLKSNVISFLGEQTLLLYNKIRQTNSKFNLISQGIQNNAHSMRLLSFAVLLNPVERTIRDLAIKQNKPVNLVIHGRDIEIDRNLFQIIFDPLVHIITNAVAHGIESPEERAILKKKPLAEITLDIKKQGDMLSIAVSDDGAGLDLNNIRKKALELNLISQSDFHTLSDDATIDLIFKPGFSSSEIITTISGRGIGLDVVQTNLRKINARIQVENRPGQGCTFTMLLPDVLSNEHGVMIKVSGKHYLIQNIAIDSVMTVSIHDVLILSGQQNIVVDHMPVPLFYLAQFLHLSVQTKEKANKLAVVLLSDGDKKAAFIVDEIVGEKEFIIKPFHYPLVNIDNTSGAALMGNGELVVVLNAIGLIDSSKKMHSVVTLNKDTHETVVDKILIVEDSSTTRTLEQNILQNAGFQVSVATNGLTAWEIIQNESFDLIITDVEMPLMNGFELVEKIKQTKETQSIPVIIMSSLDSDEDKRRGIQAGADAYITKESFKSDLLLNIIEQLL